VRKDKRKFTDDLAKEAETAASLHNMTFRHFMIQLSNSRGSSRQQITKLWIEQLQQLLDRPPPMEPPISTSKPGT